MHLTDQMSELLLASIEKGDAPFKYIPEEVGNSLLHSVKNGENWYATPYITISPNAIIVSDREYNRETLKNLWFENGNIVIEHINHSKRLFGLIEKGNIEHIPLANIGNRKLFMLYLSSVIKF